MHVSPQAGPASGQSVATNRGLLSFAAGANFVPFCKDFCCLVSLLLVMLLLQYGCFGVLALYGSRHDTVASIIAVGAPSRSNKQTFTLGSRAMLYVDQFVERLRRNLSEIPRSPLLFFFLYSKTALAIIRFHHALSLSLPVIRSGK